SKGYVITMREPHPARLTALIASLPTNQNRQSAHLPSSVRHSEVIDSSRGTAAGPGARSSLPHHGLLSRSHEESVFAGLEVVIERDAIGADRHVFRFEGNFLIPFDAGLPTRNSSKRAHLELAPISFLLQFDQHKVRRTGAV